MIGHGRAGGATAAVFTIFAIVTGTGALDARQAPACSTDHGSGRQITQAELARRIEAGDAPVLLDVRSAEEHQESHIPGAIHVAHDRLADELATLALDKDAEIVVHCTTGALSAAAEEVLREAGYDNVRNLEGHMRGWVAAGMRLE